MHLQSTVSVIIENFGGHRVGGIEGYRERDEALRESALEGYAVRLSFPLSCMDLCRDALQQLRLPEE